MTPPAIDYFSSTYPLRNITMKIAFRARKKMYKFFMGAMPVTQDATVLDVGVTPDQKLETSNFFELSYPYKSKITAISIEDASFLEQKYPGLRFIQTDGNNLPFEDKTFDIAFCSAVLEHVGSYQHQKQLVSEIVRVARHFFIITPNRLFPVEIHTFLPFIHWLPQPLHQKILRIIGMKFWAQTENLNLLTPRSLTALFPPTVKVKLQRYRLLGLPSNLIAYGTSEA